MSSDHPLVSCTCAVCHTWRRVGLLLVRPEATVPFREYALRRVRELFTELLDASDGLVLGVGGPLAGGPPVLPVGVPAASVQTPAQGPGGVAPGLTPGQAATGPATAIGPAQATSKVPPASPPPFLGVPGIPPETETPVKEEIASPVEVKTSPEKKKKSKKDKKAKDKKAKPVQAAATEAFDTPPDYSRSSEGASSHKGNKSPSPATRREQKELPESPARERSPPRRSERRRRSRSKRRSASRRGRHNSREERRQREKDSRSPRLRERERWEREPPVERVSRGSQRPPEPAGAPPPRQLEPPPGRFYPRPWGGRRQWTTKGVKRRERAQDIRDYGPDPTRKAIREHYQGSR